MSSPGARYKVAVLMPAWNAGRHIGDALGSILAQRDAARFDIIVADDGSTDETRRVVERMAASAPEIRLLVLPHRGLPFARNATLEAVTADTDIVTFLDSDDLSPPGRFSRDLAAFDDGAVEVHWGTTQRFDGDAGCPMPGKGDALERGSQLGGLLIRRESARRVGHFDEALPLGEDVDFVLRLLETRPSLAVSENVAVFYRRHATNITRDETAARKYLARVYVAAAYRRKHGAPPVPEGLFVPLQRATQ